MADQKVNELSTSTPALTDYIMGMSGTAEYKALVSAVAKKIVEDYAGSTLAGSAQSVKSALDALNSTVDFSSSVTTTHTKGSAFKFIKRGNVVNGTLALTLTSSVSAWGVVAVIPTGYRPAIQNIYKAAAYDITAGGNIRTRKALAAGDTIEESFTYIVQ